jgi:hypothetical protein
VAHHLVDQATKGCLAGARLSAAKDHRPMDIPCSQVLDGSFPLVLVFDARGLVRAGWQRGMKSAPSWMLVFSSALSTYSSAHSGWPCQQQAYRSSTGPASSKKCGSRGKIQHWWRQGRSASCISSRQMAPREGPSPVPNSTATWAVSSLRL